MLGAVFLSMQARGRVRITTCCARVMGGGDVSDSKDGDRIPGEVREEIEEMLWEWRQLASAIVRVEVRLGRPLTRDDLEQVRRLAEGRAQEQESVLESGELLPSTTTSAASNKAV